MFLRQVYHHSKWLFAAMVIFVVLQLFINYKHGMVMSPFYHYGMYSEVMKPKETYGVYEININGLLLEGKKYSPQKWDNILTPVRYFGSINSASNALYHRDIKRLMSNVFVTSNEKRFVQSCDTAYFYQSYRRYLQTILKQEISTLNIQCRVYEYKDEYLQPTNTVFSLAQLCR